MENPSPSNLSSNLSLNENQTNSFKAIYNEESKLYDIMIDDTKYSLNVNHDKVLDFLEKIDVYNIFENFESFEESYKKCKTVEVPELSKISDFKVYTPLKYYIDTLSSKIDDLSSGREKSNFSMDQCSICLCDHYEDIFKFDTQRIQDLQSDLKSDFSISLRHCGGHSFHIECIKMYLKSQLEHQNYFKCPVCSVIYGQYIGDQPNGTMSIEINELLHCEGYPDCGTIIIDYSMKDGQRGEIYYPPTHRTAYLPNNEKGKEVLELLKIAFKNKQIFTVGDSVTNGRKNVIVWNGIHHKTNLTGGSSYFGYPDETYFDRVKLELAMKGIYPESISISSENSESKKLKSKAKGKKKAKKQKSTVSNSTIITV